MNALTVQEPWAWAIVDASLRDPAAKIVENRLETFPLQRIIDQTANLNGDIHKGLWWLLVQGVDVEKEAQRIERMGGQQAMLREIKRFRLEMDIKRGGYSVSGRGILRLINWHRRNKIRVDNVEERAVSVSAG